mmetsp:Transcript_38468/g.72132  ORF Transcript_38468/g.72132 Transcript_38468/m.72132 type:complete len:108 (-) Transcript_38468:179-502(-)
MRCTREDACIEDYLVKTPGSQQSLKRCIASECKYGVTISCAHSSKEAEVNILGFDRCKSLKKLCIAALIQDWPLLTNDVPNLFRRIVTWPPEQSVENLWLGERVQEL